MAEAITIPAVNMVLTCACGAQNPRDLPYDMTKADACSTCGKAFGRPCVDPRQGVEVLPHLLEPVERGEMEQFIINAPADEAASVLRLMLESREMFTRSGGKVGWGWSLRADNGKSYFIRETSKGLSARESVRLGMISRARAALANRPSDAVAGEG